MITNQKTKLHDSTLSKNKQILELLYTEGPLLKKDICEKLKLSNRYLENSLEILLDKGLIKKYKTFEDMRVVGFVLNKYKMNQIKVLLEEEVSC